jgi:hypothetical protein
MDQPTHQMLPELKFLNQHNLRFLNLCQRFHNLRLRSLNLRYLRWRNLILHNLRQRFLILHNLRQRFLNPRSLYLFNQLL